MRSFTVRAIRCIACVLAATVAAFTPLSASAAEEKITYDDHIMPLLRTHCLNCHNPDRARGGLDLSTYMGAMNGSSGGAIIEPGDSGASKLYAVITHAQEPTMPPNRDKLPQAELDVFRKWLEAGALENKGSKAPKLKKKLDLALSTSPTGKPEGPAAMPSDVRLEPIVRTDRTNAVTAMAASPWAPLVAIGGQKQILLYHLDTQQLMGVLPFHDAFPEVIRFSRSGNVLMVGGGRGAKLGFVNLYDVNTGERLATIGNEFDTVLAADLSGDQSRIALGGPGKVVRIHATADGEVLHTITKHTDWITAVAFSPDSVLLATADRNGGLHVWEAMTGNLFYTLDGHEQTITSLDFRPDSNILASASEDGQVRLWSMHDGKRARNWNAHGGGALSVRYTHDGRLVTTGRDHHVKIWNGEGQQQHAIKASDDLTLIAAFDHEGKRVIVGDWLGAVRVFNVADGKPLGTLDTNPPLLADRIAAVAARLAEVKAAHAQRVAEHAAAVRAADEVKQQFDAAAAKMKELTEQVAALDAKAKQAREQAQTLARAELAATEALTAISTERDAAARNVKQTAETAKATAARHEEAAAAMNAAESAAQEASRVADAARAEAEGTPDDAALAQSAAEAKAAAEAAVAERDQASAALAAAAQELAQATDGANAARATLTAAEAEAGEAEQKLAQTKAAMEEARAASRQANQDLSETLKAQEAAAATLKLLDEKTKAAQELVAQKQAAMTESAQQVAAAEEEHAHWTAAQFNLQVLAARDEVQALQTTLEEHEAAAATVQQQLDAMEKQHAQLQKQHDAGPARRTLVNHAVYQAYHNSQAVEERIDDAVATAAARRTLLKQAESLHAAIRAEAGTSPDEAGLVNAARRSAATLDALKAELEKAHQRVAALESEFQDSVKAVLVAQAEVARAEAELAALPARIEELEPQIRALQAELAPLLAARDQAQQTRDAAQAKLDDLTRRYEALKLATAK